MEVLLLTANQSRADCVVLLLAEVSAATFQHFPILQALYVPGIVCITVHIHVSDGTQFGILLL